MMTTPSTSDLRLPKTVMKRIKESGLVKFRRHCSFECFSRNGQHVIVSDSSVLSLAMARTSLVATNEPAKRQLLPRNSSFFCLPRQTTTNSQLPGSLSCAFTLAWHDIRMSCAFTFVFKIRISSIIVLHGIALMLRSIQKGASHDFNILVLMLCKGSPGNSPCTGA
jgi:hypothetical protein